MMIPPFFHSNAEQFLIQVYRNFFTVVSPILILYIFSALRNKSINQILQADGITRKLHRLCMAA
ncbi:hypothetical protein BO223_07790 [Faecalibaculum rodentium]|uniref:Uncharacterized protein n=1 Tax=Faecalibaculum rodentium TaxID=1702221 RepID=A0A1Q9YJF1_9FIRM|nr:hypothetical protein BO223_07790 [Faecalibaculum rodentium]